MRVDPTLPDFARPRHGAISRCVDRVPTAVQGEAFMRCAVEIGGERFERDYHLGQIRRCSARKLACFPRQPSKSVTQIVEPGIDLPFL
jgi:hypothetical protein